MKYDPNKQVQFEDIYKESQGKLSTSSSKMDRDIMMNQELSHCYETTAWVAGAEWSPGGWQQYEHLPCFGHLSWPLHCNTAALQGTNSPHVSSLTPKSNSPRREPNCFTQPVHCTPPADVLHVLGGQNSHSSTGKKSCDLQTLHKLVVCPLTFCLFVLLLPKPTSLQIMIFYIHPPSKLWWFGSLRGQRFKCLHCTSLLTD